MKKILIVEDNENQRKLYRQELLDEGYEVFAEGEGIKAFDRIKEIKPDLVILDIQMPGINGIEILDQILSFNKNLPVILHTAYSSYKENFMSWAADAYVVKSSDLTKLKEKINEIFSK